MIHQVKLRSLAKINLDLRVLNKRPDGFHELRTVFQTISLADTLEIAYEPARRTELTIDDALAIPDNLVLRAARATLDQLKLHAKIRFKLTKSIPMGGGLGGGSSNAASVLLALPVLAGKPIDLDTLSEIGTQLGSDVPFFLTGGTALGLGRGTELYPLPDIAADPLMIVCPPVHSSTVAAYAALKRELTGAPSSTRMNSFRAFVRVLGEVRSAGPACPLSENDFEAVVCLQHPQLKALPGKLSKLGAVHASMTGSGSAFFAVFASRTERDRALQAWRQGRGNYPAFAAETVSQKRYQALWRRQLKVAGDATWPPQS
ncbi:MAG: 4-(cytidine 5'-diphospho)-2-C-methyl-D-erythritol kinase [Bryobacteraceae bacterium]